MRAAVICSERISDGLMMMVASHRLFTRGYKVTTYQDALPQMRTWFPHHDLRQRSPLIGLEQTLSCYDLVILQYENSPLSHTVINLYKKGHIHNLSVFYSHYQRGTHPEVTCWDQVFDRSKSMVENIAHAVASLLQCTQVSKNNGLMIPKDLKQSRHLKRILIHPKEAPSDHAWKREKFIKLAFMLAEKGYKIAFIVNTEQRLNWISLVGNRFLFPILSTLSHLATYVYESSFLIADDSDVGHLASNLHIPTLIIAACAKKMALRCPGWFLTHVVTPPPWIPNFKGVRLRDKQWYSFISPKRVFRHFEQMYMHESH